MSLSPISPLSSSANQTGASAAGTSTKTASQTSSLNPAIANLLENLTAINSPLMQSPQALAALENASPQDIVQLSTEATQIEGLNAMFGIGPDSSSSASDSLLSAIYQPPADAVSNLENPGTGASTATSNSTQYLANALATYQQNMQATQMDALFATSGASVLG